jgi:DNA modification methylase
MGVGTAVEPDPRAQTRGVAAPGDGPRVTLLCGDCLALLPGLEAGSVDAVVTDPPYGIGAGEMSLGKWRTSRMVKSDWDKVPGEIGPLLEMDVPTVIWGGNYFDLPPSRCWLVWDKGNGFRGRDFAECELAWTNVDTNTCIFQHDPLARGDYRDKLHPTQKPIALMAWCIERFTHPGDTVLDPFMGSGTTGVACVKLGRNFIGIERDPGYFAIAQKRIAEAQAQPALFQLPAVAA